MSGPKESFSELDTRIHAYTVLLWAWTAGAIVYAVVLPRLEAGALFLVPTMLFFFLVPLVLLGLRMRATRAHGPYSPGEQGRSRLPQRRPGLYKPSMRM